MLGTLDEIRRAAPGWHLDATLPADGYWLKTVRRAGGATPWWPHRMRAACSTAASRCCARSPWATLPADLDERQSPYAPVRWVNQWDNLNGTIERGYGGRSIFWENGQARADLTPRERLRPAAGVAGHQWLLHQQRQRQSQVLAPDFLPQIARIADAFRPWGVRVALAVDFGSPQTIGGLDTFDPLDPRVAAWWKANADEIYRAIPDFGGFVLKADSEGRVGPSTYGRTHADAANVVARALEPHGGLLFYRGFVYDHHMDWHNLKNDRARAAYDNFHDLDGKFDDNVIIQIKNGPIDFQVREPASPLFGALEKTNQAIELQVTQEYIGQARHLVFLVPMWKETLDFDMHAAAEPTPVKALVAGQSVSPADGRIRRRGRTWAWTTNWLGNHLSQANLYGFGRLAWNPDLSAQQIDDEWTRLTFGSDPKVDRHHRRRCSSAPGARTKITPARWACKR